MAVPKLRVIEGNPSGIYPTEYKVLVKPKDVGEKSAGGIYIPEETRERDKYAAMEGELIAVSPLSFTYHDWPEGIDKPKAGEHVIFAKYAGTKLTGKDGVDYRIINDRDVMAVLA